MKRLPAAKRNQLIGVIIGTVALICAVYFLLISPQNKKNSDLATQIRQESDRLSQYEKTIKEKDATTTELADLKAQLDGEEKDIASGDLYAWTVDKIRTFKTPYRIEIPSIGQPGGVSDCDLLGDFPYKQITFSLNGTAYYHDLGRFVSDFENKFTHCRVVNLACDPVNDSATGGEKLNFRMGIVALVKPND